MKIYSNIMNKPALPTGNVRQIASVRMPASLHEHLRTWAREHGSNMNGAIVRAIESLLAAEQGFGSSPDSVSSTEKRLLGSTLAARSIRPGHDRQDALQTIKERAAARGDIALAGVIASLSAEILDRDGEHERAAELAATAAAQCAHAGYPVVAEALFEQALMIDPSNESASLWLGEQLCRRAEAAGDDVELYRQALIYLDMFPWHDSALTEQAWANYFISLASQDDAAMRHWRIAIQTCLQRQLFNTATTTSKKSLSVQSMTAKALWSTQIDRLRRAGLDGIIEELEQFADKQGLWSRVTDTTTTADRLFAHISSKPEGKNAILKASGIDQRDWTPAIRQLIADGRVVKTGTTRGAKYVRTSDSQL